MSRSPSPIIDFQTVVDWLRQALGASQAVMHPDGSCRLEAGRLPIALVPQPHAACLQLRARVGHVDLADADAALEALLCANLFTDGVGASAFSLSRDADLLLNHRITYGGVEHAPFLRAFDRFVRHGAAWQACLVRPLEPGASAEQITYGLQTLPADETFGVDPTALPDADDLRTALASLLDAQLRPAQQPDECRLHMPEGEVIHLRFTTQPCVAQVAIVLGQGYGVSRSQLLITLMRSNQGLSENGNPYFALARSARDVVACKALRLIARGAPLPATQIAQAIQGVIRDTRELQEQLAGQGLLAD